MVVLSCSPESSLTDDDGSAHGASGPASGGSGGAGATGAESAGGSGTGGLDPDAACGAVHEQATQTPLDLYIMFDRSASMAMAGKWDAAEAGLATWLQATSGVKVAIKFFPIANMVTTCDQNVYKTPTVDFAPLPGNAAPIIAAMAAESAAGFDSPIY